MTLIQKLKILELRLEALIGFMASKVLRHQREIKTLEISIIDWRSVVLVMATTNDS